MSVAAPSYKQNITGNYHAKYKKNPKGTRQDETAGH